LAFSLFSYFFKRVVENMAASFKDRYRRNKETLEWYDALAMAVAVIALVFTFGVRIVKVDGHSMDPTLSNGERILINLLKKPDYDDIVVVDGYTAYVTYIIRDGKLDIDDVFIVGQHQGFFKPLVFQGGTITDFNGTDLRDIDDFMALDGPWFSPVETRSGKMAEAPECHDDTGLSFLNDKKTGGQSMTYRFLIPSICRKLIFLIIPNKT